MQVVQAVNMDIVTNPAEVMFIAFTVLLLLLSTNKTVDSSTSLDIDDNRDDESYMLLDACADPCFDIETAVGAALHTYRLCNLFFVLGEDLGYWVKPRSTAWFSKFLLNQYDDERWITMFRMTKPTVQNLAALLKPIVEKKDTKYRLAILVLVRVACTLFKLTHGASLFICSKMFAVGRSTVSTVLRDVVYAINVTLRSEIAWPSREKLVETELGFYDLYGLPGVVGAIDGTHVSINKPRFGSADYYYFKSGGYSLNCQAVVDSKKRFLDLFLMEMLRGYCKCFGLKGCRKSRWTTNMHLWLTLWRQFGMIVLIGRATTRDTTLVYFWPCNALAVFK